MLPLRAHALPTNPPPLPRLPPPPRDHSAHARFAVGDPLMNNRYDTPMDAPLRHHLERLLRHLLSYPRSPAVILLNGLPAALQPPAMVRASEAFAAAVRARQPQESHDNDDDDAAESSGTQGRRAAREGAAATNVNEGEAATGREEGEEDGDGGGRGEPRRRLARAKTANPLVSHVSRGPRDPLDAFWLANDRDWFDLASFYELTLLSVRSCCHRGERAGRAWGRAATEVRVLGMGWGRAARTCGRCRRVGV